LKIIKNKSGLTLIELTIAIAILGVVLSVAYLLYDYGAKSFRSGEDRYIVQRELRTAADLITSEVRNATIVQIVSSHTNTNNYFYILDNKFILRANGTPRDVTSAIMTSVSFTIVKNNQGRNVLKFTLNGQKGSYTHQVNSTVFLNNVPSLSNNTDIMLYFTKP
jgi:prepilin-type N-terminal cleavage/methylation domain-containing protein